MRLPRGDFTLPNKSCDCVFRHKSAFSNFERGYLTSRQQLIKSPKRDAQHPRSLFSAAKLRTGFRFHLLFLQSACAPSCAILQVMVRCVNGTWEYERSTASQHSKRAGYCTRPRLPLFAQETEKFRPLFGATDGRAEHDASGLAVPARQAA